MPCLAAPYPDLPGHAVPGQNLKAFAVFGFQTVPRHTMPRHAQASLVKIIFSLLLFNNVNPDKKGKIGTAAALAVYEKA